jgi:branched-chain amino acid transport system permease protein
VIAFPILRTRGIYMVLSTFAFAEVVGGILLNIPALGGAAGLSVMAYAGLPVVVPCAIGTVIFVAWLMRTRFGLSVRAIHDDESVAHLFGVHLRMTQVLALTIGGAIGGLGGGLLVHQFNFIDVQSTGVLFSIYVLLYVLMGGTQTVWGPLFGAVFFTLVPEALRKLSTIDPSLKFLEGGRYIVFGVAVVLIMMLRPQGVITRTMIERWTSPGRRKQEASA